MLIPCGPEVDALVRKVRAGELVTVNQLRERLAEGRKRVTPYWRVLKTDGALNPKFPEGVERQAARLGEEGFEVEPGRGKQPPRVRGYRAKLKRRF